MLSTPFIVIAPRSILTWSGSNRKGPINGSNRTVWHLNWVLELVKIELFDLFTVCKQMAGRLFCFTAYQPFSDHLTPNWISNNSVYHKYRFFFCLQTVKCRNSSISNNSIYHLHAIQMSETVLLKTIQFNISTQFSSIWPIDRTVSGATTPSQSRPGSDGNKG